MPSQNKPGCFFVLVVLIIGIALFVGLHENSDTRANNQKKTSDLIEKRNPAPRSTTTKQLVTIDKSPQAQTKRSDLIAKLIREGVFTKVEMPGSLPRVWVGTRFYGLSFDDKQTFVSVIYAYYFDGSKDTDSVRLYDNLSGKEIGSYSAAPWALGLKLK